MTRRRGPKPPRVIAAEAEEEISDLGERMATYEEAALENDEYAGFNVWRFLSYPVPNFVKTGESLQNVFTSTKTPFFKNREEGAAVDDDEDDDGAQELRTEEEKEEEFKDKMIVCAWFCIRHLFFSRLWIILLQFVAANLAGDLFKPTGVFDLADRMIEGNISFGNIVIHRGLLGLRRWDSQQYLFLAENQYILESSLAFLPGSPYFIGIQANRVQEKMMSDLGWSLPMWVLTKIQYIMYNMIFFHVAGFALFMTVILITRNVKQGLIAVTVFAYNPASIFFTAAYSDSAFCFQFMISFAYLINGLNSSSIHYRSSVTLGVSFFLGIASIIRFDGILGIIFVLWYPAAAVIWESVVEIFPTCDLFTRALADSRTKNLIPNGDARLRAFEKKRIQQRKVFRWTSAAPGHSTIMSRITYISMIIITVMTGFSVLVCVLIYASDSMGYEFCNPLLDKIEGVSKIKEYILNSPETITVFNARENATWCRELILGSFYNYYPEVEFKYWNVGLFQNWRIEKIPCFLMMLPAAILTVLALKSVWKDVFETKRWCNIWILIARTDHAFHFALHASILLFACVFVTNPENFTRLIFSSSPLLYIYIAQYIDKLTQGNIRGNRFSHYNYTLGILPFFVFQRVWEDGWRGKALYIYIFGYFILGTMAHAAWLPFK